MKTLLLVPVLAALTLGLAACGGSEGNQTAPNGTIPINASEPLDTGNDTIVANEADFLAANAAGVETGNVAESSVTNGH